MAHATEVGIYKRKQESKKKKIENTLSTKKATKNKRKETMTVENLEMGQEFGTTLYAIFVFVKIRSKYNKKTCND